MAARKGIFCVSVSNSKSRLSTKFSTSSPDWLSDPYIQWYEATKCMRS